MNNKKDVLIKIDSIEPEKIKPLIDKIIDLTGDSYTIKETTATNEFIEQEAESMTQLITDLYEVQNKNEIKKAIMHRMWIEEMILYPLGNAIEMLKEERLL